MIYFITFCNYTETFAFAINGIRPVSAKQFDWFGTYVVSLVAAVGGGTTRDILIKKEPIVFRKDIYALACLFVGVVYFICIKLGLTPSIT